MNVQRVGAPIDGRLTVRRSHISNVAGGVPRVGPGPTSDQGCVFIDAFPGVEERACGVPGEIHMIRDHRGATGKVSMCDRHVQLVHDPRSPRWLIDTLSESHHTPSVRLADTE